MIEASYLEDARVGELLRQRGKTLEAIAYLVDLWRSYPNTASIESDFFGLSQLVAKTASEAFTNPSLRHELAVAGVTRSQLLSQSIRMIQVFLACSPRNPVADEASLALVGAYTELEDFKSVDKLSARFAKLYPKSTFFDSFQYADALANFHLGQYDRAVEVAQAIANATYKDAAGADQPSPNKWQAVYILGQIYDARRQPGKALEYYRQVADRFSDAAGAIQAYTRKDLKVPEVSIVRPAARPVVADRPAGENPQRGFRVIDVVGAAERAPEPPSKPGIGLDYRNIAQVDVKVYPVDLMQLYLTRRNLNGISGIDLAGITPLVEKAVTLGSGADYDDQSRIDRAAARQGRCLPGDDSRREPLCLGDRSGLAAGDRGARRPRRRPRAHHRSRRSHQEPRAQGPGQGHRQRQPAVHLGRDRPARRLRRRRRSRHGDRRRQEGRPRVCVLSRYDLPGRSRTRGIRAAAPRCS